MDEHTPAPLAYRPCEFDDWGFVRDAQGHLVAVAKPGKFLSRDEENRHREAGTDPAEANARRFCALWNAIEGISTENLESIAKIADPWERFRNLAEFAGMAAIHHVYGVDLGGRTDG